MNHLASLLKDISDSRERYTNYVGKLTESQAHYKPSAEAWSAVENTEHLYWAEHGAICGMWRAFQGQKDSCPVWTGELIHRGLQIEEIIAKTWQPREIVPVTAAPRMGGTIAFWLSSFQNLHFSLNDLCFAMKDEILETIVHPHPISGPLDVPQRLQFIRFHIDRHLRQVELIRLMEQP